MLGITQAIDYLSKENIGSFELANVLVIPTEHIETLDVLTSRVAKLLKQCGYEGRWRIDPYYYDNHNNDDIEYDCSSSYSWHEF